MHKGIWVLKVSTPVKHLANVAIIDTMALNDSFVPDVHIMMDITVVAWADHNNMET